MVFRRGVTPPFTPPPVPMYDWKAGRGKASGRGIEIRRRRGKPEPTLAEEEEEEGGGDIFPLFPNSRSCFVPMRGIRQ